jgi:tight adherence protein C
MTTDLMLALIAVFGSVAVLTGVGLSLVLTREAPEQRRLRATPGGPRTATGLLTPPMALMESPSDLAKRLASMTPKSSKEMGRLQKRFTLAGYHGLMPAAVYALSEIGLPVILGLGVFSYVAPNAGIGKGLMFAAFAAILGFAAPGLWLENRITKRKREIENGLPDALDLFIVCLEAGSGLDQAIVRATDELGLSYPALAEELRLITNEIRAGKPRLQAFRNFADRTKVEDVRSLVGMLVQTDRFGTSVAQALRTHADVARTKRRQRAEERAGKVGVKLVFPLVLCLFPAFYVVTLGPAIIQFVRIFFGQLVNR